MAGTNTIDPKYIGKTGTVLWEAEHRQVNTWIPIADFELLQKLAKLHKVRLSTYLRAIIADAMEDERASGINTKELV